MTDKLKALLSLCKCGVFLTVNEHRDYYETAEKHLSDIEANERSYGIDEDDPPDWRAERAKMIETDTIIKLQFYPDTPVGSYTLLHHDLEAVLDQAIQVIGEERVA